MCSLRAAAWTLASISAASNLANLKLKDMFSRTVMCGVERIRLEHHRHAPALARQR